MYRRITTIAVRVVATSLVLLVAVSLFSSSHSQPSHSQSFGPTSPPVGVYTWGDANCDGSVNLQDPIAVLGYLFNSQPIPPACAQPTPVLHPSEDPSKFFHQTVSATVTQTGNDAVLLLGSGPAGVGIDNFVVTQVRYAIENFHGSPSDFLRFEAGNFPHVDIPVLDSTMGGDEQVHEFEQGLTYPAGTPLQVRVVAPHGMGHTYDYSITVIGYHYEAASLPALPPRTNPDNFFHISTAASVTQTGTDATMLLGTGPAGAGVTGFVVTQIRYSIANIHAPGPRLLFEGGALPPVSIPFTNGSTRVHSFTHGLRYPVGTPLLMRVLNPYGAGLNYDFSISVIGYWY